MGLLGHRCGRRTAVLLAVVVLFLVAGPDGAEGYQTYRLCGKRLADILELICKGRGFHDPYANAEPGKRVVTYTDSGMGVSDECCRQGCTRRTMESYCSAEPIEKKQPAPERPPEPMGDHRHPHRNANHPDSVGREAAEGEAAAKASSASDASEDSTSKVTSAGRGGGSDGGVGHSGGGGKRGAGRRRKGERRRRRGGGGGRAREGGDSEERGQRGGKGAGGRKCRCKRRRRKTDAEATKRQLSPGSFQIGTIAPSFRGTPVILPRAKLPPALS